MASSQLDVCNLALSRLGQGEIASLDEQSTEAQACRRFWDADRRATLRDYPWNFAASSPTPMVLLWDRQCPMFTPAPAWVPVDFRFVYQLPPDSLRALELYDGNTGLSYNEDGTIGVGYPATDISLQATEEQTITELMFFQVRRGRRLVTNLPCALLKYTTDIINAGEFDDQFVEMFSYRLAIDLALPVTANPAYANTMTALYRASLLAARTSDARERKDKPKIGKAFLQSRR